MYQVIKPITYLIKHLVKSWGFVLMLLTYSLPSYAGIKDFESQIQRMGFVSNITKPAVIDDQRAGFMTGGSMTIRGNVANNQLATLQLPSLKAGCGGIDLFAGGLGYLNASQIINLIRNLPQNVTSYGVLLAMDSVSPEMGNITKGLEATARFINSQNINSCQLSASIASGLWAKNEASERMACQARSMGSNAVSDFFTARHKCSNDEVTNTNRERKNVYDLNTLLGTEYNLVWKALNDKGITDKSTISVLMSISGTYISKIVNKKVVPEFKSSLASNPELIEAFMNGGSSAPLYVCSDSECLNVAVRNGTISQGTSLIGKIEALIESLAHKMRSENAGNTENLTAEEQNLIRMTAFPIIPMIRTEITRKSGNAALSVNEYIEAISFDIAINYLEEMLEVVYGAVLELEHAQFDGSVIESFRKEMRQVRKQLQNYKQVGISRTKIIFDVKRRTEVLEKQLSMVFDEYSY